MVDINTPGITVNPINTMGGFRSNATFYDDVRVPKDCLIGEENRGWSYINAQLTMERVGLVSHSKTARYIELMTEWAKHNSMDGKKVIDEPWVRPKLAELTSRMEVLKLFNYRVAWQLTQGVESMAEASMTKVFATELNQRIARTATKALGLYGGLFDENDDKWTPMGRRWSRSYLSSVSSTIAGGTSEIQRNVIATRGLGLPRG